MTGTAIYYLTDPDGSVRYVGFSRRPSVRLRAHLRDGKDGHNSQKAAWIKSLLDSGTKPAMSVRCIVQTKAEAERIETALIASLLVRGERLTNLTPGGDGGDTRSRHPRRASICAKQSAALKGRKHPAGCGHCAAVRSAGARRGPGFPKGNSLRAGLPPWDKGQAMPPEYGRRVSASITPESRKRRSEMMAERHRTRRRAQ